MAEAKKKMVNIFIPYVEGETEYIFVSVNDVDYQIKRGESVEVPVEVAEVIQNSNIQNAAATKRSLKLQKEAEEIK